MLISQALRRLPFLVGQLLDWPASAYPDKPALEWEGGSLTFSQLVRSIAELKEELQLYRAAKGQRWGILLGNSPDFIISLFALLGLGAVAVPLRSNLPPEKLADQVRSARLDGILTSTELRPQLAGAEFEESRVGSLHLLFSGGSSVIADQDSTPLIDLDPALVLLTSGSTGFARGVVLAHHAILANLRSNIASLDLRDDDRTLAILPLSHAYALVHQCLCHLMIGATVCLLPSTLAAPMLHRYLASFRITTLSTVPPVLQMLVAGLKRSKSSLPALRLVTVGAAFADRQAVTDFLALLPHTRLAVTYGLTEAGPRVSTHFVEPDERFNPERVGLPLPNVALSLHHDQDGRKEIVVRSRAAMSGYLADLDNRVNEPPSQVRTGDTGYLSEGELFLKGRHDRIINRGGTLVGAEQIESVLLAHPAIASGRVEAEEHPFWGEVPVATVTLAPGAKNIDEGKLKEYCASCLSVEERPYKFVIQPSGALLQPSKTEQLSILLKRVNGN